MSQNLHVTKNWHDMSGRASPYMGTLVSALFAFGSHANIFPLWCGSPLYIIAMTLHKSLILLLIFLLAFSPGLPYVKFNFIIMSFSYLIDPYPSFPDFDYQPYRSSLSHV